MWNKKFTDDHRDFCKTVAVELLEIARDNGIPAPDAVFQPEETEATSERSEIRLIQRKPKKSGNKPNRS
jgi:hypothetical protein